MADRSLSERLEELRVRDVSELDSDAVERALQAKEGISAHVERDDEARGFADRLAKYRAEGRPKEPEFDEHPTAPRLTRWFFGRDEQLPGSGVVTPVPATEEGWQEAAFYSVDAPYAFIRILESEKSGELVYDVLEPPLDDRANEIRHFVHEALVRGLRSDPGPLGEEERREFLKSAVEQVLLDYRIRVDKVNQQRIEYYILRDFLGLGPIHPIMRDPNIEDISCDGPGVPIFVFHRDHEAISSSVQFADDAELDAFVIRMAQQAGKAISISDPILDAALQDGSRLQATLGREVTENGSTFTIRRFRPDPFSPIELVRFGTMSAQMLAWFWLIVEHGHSLVFSGGTASGKTTSLNAICQFIPQSAKVVTIEDTREINLPHENWIKAVTRSGSSTEGVGEIGMFELLKAALRQRPEFILVGEVRGIEATVAFQAMATGHTVYSTMHADSARSVVYRLENDPINIPRLVLQALDVIAIQAQVRSDGKRVRRVREVVEVVGMDPTTRELLTNRAFSWDSSDDHFAYAGRSYLLERIARERNWTAAQLEREFERRTDLVRKLAASDDPRPVHAIVRAYQRAAREREAGVAAEGQGAETRADDAVAADGAETNDPAPAGVDTASGDHDTAQAGPDAATRDRGTTPGDRGTAPGDADAARGDSDTAPGDSDTTPGDSDGRA